MKKFFNIFFVTLGVIFFILIVIGTYLFITDPLDLRSALTVSDSNSVSAVDDGSTQIDKNPMLNAPQEKALETFGIDPAVVPTDITPEQESCFEGKLGQDRVGEIKAGDVPTVAEYFKARDCI
jgi:hypothetical protein